MPAAPRLIIPALSSLYSALQPCGYAFLRATSGIIMASFGHRKLFGSVGMGRDIAEFQHLGLEPAVFLAYFTCWLELAGGLMIAIGLLTRPIAAMFVGELLVIFFLVMIPRGSGFELTVTWLGVFVLILLHGGGRVSLDRLLGREF